MGTDTVLLSYPDDLAGMNEEYAKAFAANPPPRVLAKLRVELPNISVAIMLNAYVLE